MGAPWSWGDRGEPIALPTPLRHSGTRTGVNCWRAAKAVMRAVCSAAFPAYVISYS